MRLYNIIEGNADNYLTGPDNVDFKILETDFKTAYPKWRKWSRKIYLSEFTDFLLNEKGFKELSAYIYVVGGHDII